MNNLSHLFTDLEPSLLDTTHQNPVFRWVTVASLSPLQIQLDYTTTPLAAHPCSLIADLKVGDRVWAMLVNKKIVILGRATVVGSQSSSTTAGFTVAAGWDLVGWYTFRRLGGVAYYSLTVSRTGGTITVNTKGDIANTRIGSITPAQRPSVATQLSSGGTGRGAFGGVWTNGDVDLAAVAGSADIVNGDQIQLMGIGLLE